MSNELSTKLNLACITPDIQCATSELIRKIECCDMQSSWRNRLSLTSTYGVGITFHEFKEKMCCRLCSREIIKHRRVCEGHRRNNTDMLKQSISLDINHGHDLSVESATTGSLHCNFQGVHLRLFNNARRAGQIVYELLFAFARSINASQTHLITYSIYSDSNCQDSTNSLNPRSGICIVLSPTPYGGPKQIGIQGDRSNSAYQQYFGFRPVRGWEYIHKRNINQKPAIVTASILRAIRGEQYA